MAFPLSLLRYRFVNGIMSECAVREVTNNHFFLSDLCGCLSLGRSKDMLQHRSNGKAQCFFLFYIFLSLKERRRKIDSKEMKRDKYI